MTERDLENLAKLAPEGRDLVSVIAARHLPQRHSREGGKPSNKQHVVRSLFAADGPQSSAENALNLAWIPACAGMTSLGEAMVVKRRTR